MLTPAPMVDPFARAITYLRVSVTDRCDFRCVYCMAEDMTFLPKADVLSLEELDRLCSAFIAKGVRKLRLTGGEPLVRRGIMTLVSSLARHIETGALDELTLTTNGSQLRKYASELAGAGVKRINVSIDTLDPDKFRAITRWGDLHKVLDGVEAARAAGLAVKINVVALKGVNEDEFDQLVTWAHGLGMELTLIEVMPLGDVGAGRLDQYLPLSIVRARLSERTHRNRRKGGSHRSSHTDGRRRSDTGRTSSRLFQRVNSCLADRRLPLLASPRQPSRPRKSPLLRRRRSSACALFAPLVRDRWGKILRVQSRARKPCRLRPTPFFYSKTKWPSSFVSP